MISGKLIIQKTLNRRHLTCRSWFDQWIPWARHFFVWKTKYGKSGGGRRRKAHGEIRSNRGQLPGKKAAKAKERQRRAEEARKKRNGGRRSSGLERSRRKRRGRGKRKTSEETVYPPFGLGLGSAMNRID